MKIIRAGSQVAYSRKFIRSIQGHELAHRRGTLISTQSLNSGTVNHILLARVIWHDGTGEEISSCLLNNLVAVDHMHMELA